MRFHHELPILVVLISAFVGAANIPIRRQDATTATGKPEAHITSRPTNLATIAPTSTTAQSSALIATTIADLSGAQPTLASSSSNASSGALYHGGLPIEPAITPAMGVTGVVLITAGVAYSLVGIKNPWLHVFLSAAFLTSLSITVLIEYVMSPPVSNGIQGAYFVAAFSTGLIFGGLSLIFKELTEGLGCLLGGFCLSMWLLSLKDGGLLTSPGSKGAFIGAFCVAAYAFSFTSYTRPYALIASTAFAGSTAAVLGVDCFSRAGLKEFWLYNWGLNDNAFPLDTTTYPVTRGIRVELAVIIVIFLLGLLSQFRLWKVIRERRQKQEAAMAEEKRKRDEAEVELGRTIEERKLHELARWEAVYGDNPQRLSTEADPPISQLPQKQPEAGTLEEVPDASAEKAPMSIADCNIASPDNRSENAQNNTNGIDEEAAVDMRMDLPPPEKPEANDNDTMCGDRNEISGGEPVQVPAYSECVASPPFNIPCHEEKENEGDDHSIEAILDDGDSAVARLSKRLSAVSLLRRLSHRSNIGRISRHGQSDSKEMLVSVSRASSTSSVRGNVDSDAHSALENQNIMSSMEHERILNRMSSEISSPGPASTSQSGKEIFQEGIPTHDHSNFLEVQTKSSDRTNSGTGANMTGTENLGRVTRKRRHTFDGVSLALPIDKILSTSVASPSFGTTETTFEKVTSVKNEDERSPSHSSLSQPGVEKKESLTAVAVEDLPSHTSPLITCYRTNEWAKHLSGADTPELGSNAVDTMNVGLDGEATVPVKVEELVQTATTALPIVPREMRTPLVEKHAVNPVHGTSSNISKQSTRETTPIRSPSIRVDEAATYPATVTAPNAASNPNLLLPATSRVPISSAMPGELRSVSTPFLSTSITAAPIHESQVALFDNRLTETSLSLLAQRERMVQSRLSSISLTRDSWIPRSPSGQSLEDGFYSPRSSQLSLADGDGDDMPLAQRRALLLQRASSPVSLNMKVARSPVDAYPVTNRLSRESNKSTESRSKTMAAWRESLQEDLTRSQTPLAEVNVARKELIEHQRKAHIARHQRVLASENLDNSIAERMRRGDMQDLHREAMRRMQAAANRKAQDNA